MRVPRPALALALASALVLSACSGDSEGADSEPAGADAATSTAGVGAESTEDGSTEGAGGAEDAAETTAPGQEQAATAAGESQPSGVVSVEESEQIASDVLTMAVRSTKRNGDKALGDIKRAYSGPDRRAHEVAEDLEDVTGRPPKVERHLGRNPLQPTVLAVSQDDEKYPQYILAQAVPEWAGSDVPELYLLVRPKEGADFKIRWSAPMLPGTEVGLFERRSTGSPVLRNRSQAKEALAQRPTSVLNELADYVGHPPSEGKVSIRTNGYAPEVRRNAREQASDISASADFMQTDELLPDALHTLQLADGSAMSFAVMERTAHFHVRDGHTLVPPDTFAHLAGDDALGAEATMTALVFVAVRVPAADEDRPPAVIAAREQVVAASGS
ncbi:hypothetical protein [Ornithinicoccus halotolerans]|uniref:hypothetical protein n=1 Tax=Ornithinicoccus halotolerans TaxID=1748220 RepID=UPI0012954E42|nr:hypothetical protein [Ornithinicoccus halotolerans]